MSFSHDGGPFLNYAATATFVGDDAAPAVPLTAESGFWRLARPAAATDAGPALLPPTATPVTRTVDDVETLRSPNGAFPLEVSLARSDGMLEYYVGEINGPRVDLSSDAIVRGAGAKDYASAADVRARRRAPAVGVGHRGPRHTSAGARLGASRPRLNGAHREQQRLRRRPRSDHG